MATIKEMVEHVEGFTTSTVRDRCGSIDDLLKLASQLAFQAASIYEQLGGKQHAAEQFYAMADDLATGKTVPTTGRGDGRHD